MKVTGQFKAPTTLSSVKSKVVSVLN